MNSRIDLAADCLKHKSERKRECVDLVGDCINLIETSKTEELVKVITSPATISLMSCDDVAVRAAVLHLLGSVLNLLREKTGAVAEDAGGLVDLFDELVICLSDTEDSECARCVVVVLLRLLDSHSSVLCAFRARYANIRPVLHRWRRAGFPLSLLHLAELIVTGDSILSRRRHIERAACVIQARYRGWRTRRQLESLRGIIFPIQRRFRLAKYSESADAARRFNEEERRFRHHLRHIRSKQRVMMTLYDKVHQMSEGEALRFMNERRQNAASLIQNWWRAGRAYQFTPARPVSDCRQNRAATIVQRWWRKLVTIKQTTPVHDQRETPTNLSHDYYQRLINKQLVDQSCSGGSPSPIDLPTTRRLLSEWHRSQHQVEQYRRHLRQLLAEGSSHCQAEAERSLALVNAGLVDWDTLHSPLACLLNSTLVTPPTNAKHSPLLAQISLTR